MKLAQNLILHEIIYKGQNIFHIGMSNFLTAISQKGPEKILILFFQIKTNHFST